MGEPNSHVKSLRHNLAASYVSQIYVALLGILVVPAYLREMGVEAYGLIGFFSLLQTWFGLLDAGLTPTVARESARFHGGALDALSYRQLLRALERVFVGVAVLGGVVLVALSWYIASGWLQASTFGVVDVREAVQVMAVIISLRWMNGLYRGAITGAERFVWLGVFSSAVATARFIGVLPMLALLGPTPRVFFVYQLVVAMAELAGLLLYSRRLRPRVAGPIGSSWNSEPLRKVLKFSLTIAFTSGTWIIVTQSDKLVLSRLLSLSEYGQYTLSVMVASGVLIVTGPVSAAVLPRLARLEAERDEAGLIRLYRAATQLVAVVAGATSVTIAVWAESLLAVWTGDATLAHAAAPVLSLYAIGNGILAVLAFPYYLQYAKGDLRLHVIGSAGFVLLLLPSSIIGALKLGGVGAGLAWIVLNALYFSCWLPFIHARLSPGLNRLWYSVDVLPIFAATGVVGGALSLAVAPSRTMSLVPLLGIGMLLLLVALAASSEARRVLRVRWSLT